nr:glycosyltransferase [Sinomicrobium sp. N-1-3-6]
MGRLVDRKGINELYTAFDELYHEDTDIRLLMVGSVEKQQIADKDLIAKYNNHPGIIMVGKVPFEEVPVHMALMDCFVLPAWWEGFGNVLIQAAAMGIPIISTHSTGCSNAVSDGYNGVLVKPIKNAKVIKEAMDNMKGNKEEAAVYGDNGIQWARNFEPIIIWQGLEKIYNESENL